MRKSRYDEGLVDEQIDIEVNFLELEIYYRGIIISFHICKERFDKLF